MKSPGIDANKYGTAAGYSEDYGMQETQLQAPEYQQQVPAAGNGSQAAAPVNPFTQQQYQTNSTNPFAK